MKKFTKLEEDLIKETASAKERFEIHYDEIMENLESIKLGLQDYKKKFLKDPSNWGFVGSIANFNEELSDMMKTMNFKTEIQKNTEKYNL